MQDFLLDHARSHPVSFHMPGHKGSELFRRYGYDRFLDQLVDCDITEIPGADNLFQAEGIIKETQAKYADLYDVDHSYLLINGTSSGLIAAILASVKPGGALIMARNCHKSVFNALTLGNIQPIYAMPDHVDAYHIAGSISAGEIERCLGEHPEADAVILPSPNYYGICSDITDIARVVHQAGKILIVDQAHGAHLKFFHKFHQGEGMPLAAEDQKADIVVGSIHKTLASLTQSAVLNLREGRVDRYVLEDKLQAIQSTSPSYILMGFLDLNADLLMDHGVELMKQWRYGLDLFYREADTIPGLSVMKDLSASPVALLDRTKINLDMSAFGLDGAGLEKELLQRHIFPELFAGNLLMCMTGIGTTEEHLRRLLAALREIASSREKTSQNSATSPASEVSPPLPGSLHAVPAKATFASLSEATGRVCAGAVVPYPPGIPIVCPGETFTDDVIAHIQALRRMGEKVLGVNDQGQVLVGK